MTFLCPKNHILAIKKDIQRVKSGKIVSIYCQQLMLKNDG